MVDVGKELLCALDFTFLQGTFLQGEVSLPRRGRKPEELLIHELERTFRLDSNQRGEDFPSARGTKNLCLAEGVSPRGYWFTVWRDVPTGLEPDGTRRERPSAHVGWSGYWFEPEERI